MIIIVSAFLEIMVPRAPGVAVHSCVRETK